MNGPCNFTGQQTLFTPDNKHNLWNGLAGWQIANITFMGEKNKPLSDPANLELMNKAWI